MAYQKSLLDEYSTTLSSVVRNIESFKIDITGSITSLLRISKEIINYAGDESWTLTSEIVDNCILQVPLSEAELLSSVNESTGEYSSAGINLWDLLPVKLFVKYDSMRLTASKIKRGDLFVKILVDEDGNKIPITFKVTKCLSTFLGVNKIRDKFELAIARETAESDIQQVIDNYITNFGATTIINTNPINGFSGIVNFVEINFSIGVDTNSVLPSGIIFTPSISGLIYNWGSGNSGLIISGIVPNIYNMNITTDLLSEFQVPLQQEYQIQFMAI